MKFYVLLIITSIFISFFASISFGDTTFAVGVSPPVVNMGEIERGTTNLVKFYIVTVSEEPLLVYLEPENGMLDFFDSHYNNFIFNYSEEGSSKWVRFLSNPVELKPTNNSLNTGYETIKGWKEVDFMLQISKDAEPGYHLIKIRPAPASPSGSSGRIGTMVVAVTSVNILFKIPGDANRKGIILDTVSEGSSSPNQVEINTYFQNTGTVTISAYALQKIYDKNGNFITQISSSKEYLRPNEAKPLKSFLSLSSVPFGDYDVYTTVDYTTDSAYKNSTVSITSGMMIAKAKAEEFPMWVFIVIIIIIAIIIYRWTR